jgi:hypothetical protein
MKAHHRKRLERLESEIIPNIPRGRFNMASWADKDRGCKAVGCAFGWAASDPAFRKAGLRLDASWLDPAPNLATAPKESAFYSEPVFKGEEGFHAAVKFFGISFYEAEDLFGPDSYDGGNPTKAQVRARIRKLLKKHS